MAGWADNNVAIASSLFFIVDLEEEGVLILPIPSVRTLPSLKKLTI
jgi:hypothetical protein